MEKEVAIWSKREAIWEEKFLYRVGEELYGKRSFYMEIEISYMEKNG